MTIVCTTDSEYYPLLKILAKSLAQNSPDTNLYVRFVNCEIECAKEIKEIHDNSNFLFDYLNLCEKRKKLQRSGAPLQDEMFGVYSGRRADGLGFKGAKWLYSEKMAYCSNIKFHTISITNSYIIHHIILL